MNSGVEVRSVLWQKLFVFVLVFPCFVVGCLCWLAPFVPSLMADAPSSLSTFLLGAVYIAAGFGLWWPVMRYSIRADEKGITQTNGFFSQTVLWGEVEYYYLERNKRHHTDRHVEPVMFDAQGKKVFRGFAHLLVSTPPIVKQRRALWQFVESQLEGKKRETPRPELTPEVLADRALYVDWSQKRWQWKVRRILFLVAYSSMWCCSWMSLIFYLDDKSNSNDWTLLLMLILLVGAPFPFAVWSKFKKRKILRDMKERGVIR
ncbi:hypothetical protein IAD21_03971 [Abditibacteriota bacterium]|nr:hypothetical protein IAD21_03971 [Abditibacteriota bacterium]